MIIICIMIKEILITVLNIFHRKRKSRIDHQTTTLKHLNDLNNTIKKQVSQVVYIANNPNIKTKTIVQDVTDYYSHIEDVYHAIQKQRMTRKYTTSFMAEMQLDDLLRHTKDFLDKYNIPNLSLKQREELWVKNLNNLQDYVYEIDHLNTLINQSLKDFHTSLKFPTLEKGTSWSNIHGYAESNIYQYQNEIKR